MSKTRRLFCLGLGYTAQRLAARAAELGWSVAGSCRDDPQRDRLMREGCRVWLFDRNTPLDGGALAEATHILSSIPPDALGDPVVDTLGERIRRLDGLEWVGYLSTTGVYGDGGGDWVDEHSACNPTSARSRRRLDAERAWQSLHAAHGVPLHIFRLAAIYGLGRSVLDAVRTGRARRIDKPGHQLSRIHVDDIVAILAASMEAPQPGAIFNLCDDEPAPQHEVVAYACALLDVEPPPLVPFAAADLSDMARSFYADNRRVRNDRVKSTLGLTMRYRSYREGLAAIVATET